MRHGQVTPAFVHPVIPVLYLDLDVENDSVIEGSILAYPGLQALKLTDSNPDGKLVYRIEGPLPVLTAWLMAHYTNLEALETLAQAKLAS